MNDSYGNDPRLQRRAGAAEIILHPDDASSLGISDGERVRVSNDEGSIELQAQVATLAPPGTAVAYKGRWPSLEANGANPNFLHAGQKCDMGESTSVHGIEVQVTAGGDRT